MLLRVPQPLDRAIAKASPTGTRKDALETKQQEAKEDVVFMLIPVSQG
jgi:hypothetical protein